MNEPTRSENALAQALENTYLEILPASDSLKKSDVIPDGAHVGITCSPKMGIEATLELTEALSARKLVLIPHIAARQVIDRNQLNQILERLKAAGVDSIFVPGGDLPQPAGIYASSLDMLREIADSDYSFSEIGVTAYPEGHPIIDEATLLEALKEKEALSTYFVTQMCFEAKVLIDWMKSIRQEEIANPAWIGLPGALSRRKLFSIAGRIGVGDSLRFARRQADLVSALLKAKTYEPGDLLLEIMEGSQDLDLDLGIAGFHLFSFNQISSSLEWKKEMLKRAGPAHSHE